MTNEIEPFDNHQGLLERASEPKYPMSALALAQPTELEELRAQKSEAATLRQHILTSPLSYKDICMQSSNQTGLLSKLLQLKAKIDVAVGVILNEQSKDTCKCNYCDRIECNEKAQLALKHP